MDRPGGLRHTVQIDKPDADVPVHQPRWPPRGLDEREEPRRLTRPDAKTPVLRRPRRPGGRDQEERRRARPSRRRSQRWPEAGVGGVRTAKAHRSIRCRAGARDMIGRAHRPARNVVGDQASRISARTMTDHPSDRQRREGLIDDPGEGGGVGAMRRQARSACQFDQSPAAQLRRVAPGRAEDAGRSETAARPSSRRSRTAIAASAGRRRSPRCGRP